MSAWFLVDCVKMVEVISCFGCQIGSGRMEKYCGCLTSFSEYCSCLDVCLHVGLAVSWCSRCCIKLLFKRDVKG